MIVSKSEREHSYGLSLIDCKHGAVRHDDARAGDTIGIGKNILGGMNDQKF